MNVFSLLDTSDNEDEVVQPKKTTKAPSADTKKPVEGKVVDAAKNGKAIATKSDTKPSKPKEAPSPAAAHPDSSAKASAPKAAAAEGDVQKDNNRGNQKRGPDRRGEKRHERGASKPEGDKSGKREFDRRSGTGRGREVARGGRGPYGAGSVEQEALEAEKDPDAAVADATPDAEGAEAEASETVAVEPAVKVLSLDDFMRQKQESRASSKLLVTQNAGRAVQSTGLSAPLAGKPREETTAEKLAKKEQRSSGKSQGVEVSFKFESPAAAPPSRPRFGEGDRDTRRPDSRGGRDPPRGNRDGRGDSRRNAGASASVNMSTADFPALN